MDMFVVTETSPRCEESPDGFLGKLRPQQQALLHLMKRAERKNYLDSVQYDALSLSAPFGFGKTIAILALVNEFDRHAPPRGRISLNNYFNTGGSWFYKGTGLNTFVEPSLQSQAWWYPTHYIPCTLVLCSANVLTQWERAIHTFTPRITYFVVDGVGSLRKFEKILRSGEIGRFQLVMVKSSGTVTPSFRVEGEPAQARPRPIINALNMVCEGLPWDRVVIDDYDTVNLTQKVHLPIAYMTWYVSATDRKTSQRAPYVIYPLQSEFKFDPYVLTQCPILGASFDPFLKGRHRVIISPEFLKSTYTMPEITYVRHQAVLDKDLKFVCGLTLSPEALEALRGNAPAEAAALMGLNCKTASELLTRIIGKAQASYIKACRTLEAIDQKDYGALDLPPRDSGDFAKAIATKRTNAEKAKKEHHPTLERFRGNLKEGECQVCLTEWEDGDVRYVMNCCQLVICKFCVVQGEGFIRKCPGCRFPVHNNIVSVEEGVCTEIATGSLPQLPEDAEEVGDTLCEQVLAATGKHKLHALFRIVAPEEKVEDLRILVATFHAGSTRLIQTNFEKFGISFSILRGSRRQRDQAVVKFKGKLKKQPGDSYANILLVTAGRDCAGLDLPQCTDIIFFHHMADKAVQEQIIGRGQRLGRKGSLRVHSICFPGEYDVRGR